MPKPDHRHQRLENYRKTGFWIEQSCFSLVEVERMRAETERLWASLDFSQDHNWVHWRNHETKGRIADRLDPVRFNSEYFGELCVAPAVKGLAEDLLGGSVFVLKDKLVRKEPQTSGYGVHQDLPYWDEIGIDGDEILTATIAIDAATEEHGPLMLYPGLHDRILPGAPDNPLDVDRHALEETSPFIAVTGPGDVVFFHSRTPHGSAANRASTPRRVYHVTYARDHGNSEEIIARYHAQIEHKHGVHRRVDETAPS
ncbi:MAG: phytanoyl-CoA dioxygenase family protein [Pseudomonadota bacterium]